MVGRLSFDRHGGARAGADGAVSSRGSERRVPGVRLRGLGVRRASSDGRTEDRESRLSASFAEFIRRVFKECFG
ncbi:hypothetical protein GCM10027075_68930 [Streptomyces heilongjiangensis]